LRTKLADYNRQFHSLLDLVEETGQAQAAQLAQADGGKVPAGGYWRVPPQAERVKGQSIDVITPKGDVVKSRWPKNGCSEQTVRILSNNLKRFGFDERQARADRNQRTRDASAQAAEMIAEAERARHAAQRAAQADKPAPRRKMRKKWPKEVLSIEDISPLQALHMLEEPGDGSRLPRPISRGNVERFKRILDEGRWRPVVMYVDWYGQVVDGRHRLTAITEGDRTVPCKIIYGVDPDDFEALDTPYRRTGGHTLYTKGLATRDNQGRMSSALKLLDDVLTGRPVESWGDTVENDMVVGLALKYPEIGTAMAAAYVLHTGRRDGVARFMPSAAIVFCFLAMRAWPDCGVLLDKYVMAVTTGEDVGGNDPRKRLYNLMVAEGKGRKSSGAAKSAQILQLMLLLKMWNKYCRNETQNKAASWEAREGVPTPVTEAEVMIEE
jgi:hypothetical protein